MTKYTVIDSGKFRLGEEGVFSEGKCIFMALLAEFVYQLMSDLFNWMEESKNEIHPLILSSIFHYEFVFIHPFSDGNGRIARLWHSAILAKWKPIFEYIPIESQIDKILDEVSIQLSEDNEFSENIKKLLDVMEYDVPYTNKLLWRS